MKVLERIEKFAKEQGKQIAFAGEKGELTYEQLWQYSDALAAYISQNYKENRNPIVVYGHKNPYMIVCFLACVKAGRAYCPVDICMPLNRVQDILDATNTPLVLGVETEEETLVSELFATEVEFHHDIKLLELSDIKEQCEKCTIQEKSLWVTKEDIFYIIYTSGSTGKPKGVMISYGNLNHYLDWSVDLGNEEKEKAGKRFLNQAPFSFDLSVMDLYTCLAVGGTLVPMTKKQQASYRTLMPALENCDASVWVSTPSFADMCLAEKGFGQEMLSHLDVFLFCGETLTLSTARQLRERFPKAVIMNTYGPTESTVAVTEVVIDKEYLNQEEALPVGKAKPGTIIQIVDEAGNVLEDGEEGEIIILGDTVSPGYYGSEELTKKAFFEKEVDGQVLHAYHTGDLGTLKKGMLYYGGRMDLQVKMHGYRIEIEDIENNLLLIENISQAVVVPQMKEGKVRNLVAFLVADIGEESSFAAGKKIKDQLKQFLPEYMVPKKIKFLDEMPRNDNGKINRKYLGGLLS